MITTEEALEFAEVLDATFDALEGSTVAGSMVRALVTERDLAEKAIKDAPHDMYCGLVRAQQRTTYCNCWKAEYAVAKGAL